MSKKHRKTLEKIFETPVRSDVRWSDIESLFVNRGASIKEAAGSRVCVILNGIKMVFHRPHPRRETDKGAIISIRRFLRDAGVGHDEI